MEERQELAQLFGEVAFEQVHKISEQNGWKEGSPEKIALHGFIGGLMADLGGGNVLSGSAGAAFNEALQRELGKIKDPGLHQIASGIVGGVAGKVIGGDASAGASTGASGTKNNYYGEEYVNEVVEAVLAKGKEEVKNNINNLIEAGVITNPDEMTNDFNIYMNGASLPIRFVAGAAGYIVDKKGNVYGLIEADGGFGVSTPVQVTVGFGNFSGDKENRGDYIRAIEGWSFGGGGAAGLQVTGSVSTSGVVSSEITGTTAMGTTIISGRYVKYLFNLKDA